MYAQRFGSLPIAHRTGGLADTIRDDATGFLFSDFSVTGFLGAIRRAFSAFASARRFDAMRRDAMASIFDWTGSAQRYSALYGEPHAGTRAAD
jgi:starch synthase